MGDYNMSSEPTFSNLQAELEKTINLLQRSGLGQRVSVPADPLTSLLEQCQAVSAEIASRSRLRMVHHFACTGGTLVSKCIAALPNIILASEIDPLSRLGAATAQDKPLFAPTDLIGGILNNPRNVSDAAITQIFKRSVAASLSALSSQGLTLVVRDHPHSHFCTSTEISARPTVREMLSDEVDVLSVVTVRHPLDSFLSLEHNNWIHFSPRTLDEYCRRYHLFLDRHAPLPLVKYEDFQDDPEKSLKEICKHLSIDYSPLALDTFWVIALSGDSGRKSRVISKRARRDINDKVLEEIGKSTQYEKLCLRLGYGSF
ncbi:MAG: sulfotransferase [Donghicola sp.]|nr:sulfotransferase [Donghicola sp.]